MQADVDVVFLFREAGTYLFSKERVYHRTDPDLRQQAIQLVREARHQTRTIATLDSQREMDVTAALRSRTDRIFLGRQWDLRSFSWRIAIRFHQRGRRAFARR